MLPHVARGQMKTVSMLDKAVEFVLSQFQILDDILV